MAKETKKEISVWPQVIAAITINLIPSMVGLNLGFFGMSMPLLRDDKKIGATDADLGGIVSSGSLGNLVGTALALAFQIKIGYKKVILIGGALALAGHLVAAYAVTISSIKLGMALIGITVGISGTASQMYLMEIGDDDHKAVFAASGGLSFNLGMLLAYLIGASVSWRGSLWIESIVPFTLLVRMMTFPEVPSWLVSRGDVKNAENAIVYFRGDERGARKEVQDMVAIKKQQEATTDASKTGLIADVKDMFSPKIFGNLMLLWVMFMTAAASGSAGIMIFGKDIYRSIAGGAVSDDAITIIMGAIRMLLAMSAGFFIQALTRRALLITSGVGMGSCMLLYAWSNLGGHTPSPLLAGIAFLGYDVFCTPGYFTVPFILLGELFPLRCRGTVASVSMCFNAVFFGVAANIFTTLKSTLSVSGLYTFNAMVAFAGTAIVFLWLPETKGKSLAEIEAQFAEDPKKKD